MSKSKNLLSQGLDNIINRQKEAESVRLAEREQTEQQTERPTVVTEVQSDLNKKVERTPYDNSNHVTQETPNTSESSEVYLTERERVKAHYRNNPSGKKRPTVAFNGTRAKKARTYREAFQMTVDLGDKLDNYIKATNGNKSEFIRRAIAHELGKVRNEQ